MRTIVPTFGLGLGFMIFFYGDSIMDEGMTDDTHVDWSSCTSEMRRHFKDTMRYISCSEPASVWLVVLEDPAPVGYEPSDVSNQQLYSAKLDAVNESFELNARTHLDAMTSAQTLALQEIYTPWEGVEVQKIIVKHDVNKEPRAHGLTQSLHMGDVFITTLCLSKTTTHEMCENMLEVVLFEGVDHKLDR